MSNGTDQDRITAHLLRTGGVRPTVPPDRERRVRQAFLEQCRTMARARVLRRRLAIAASGLVIAASAIVGVRLLAPVSRPEPTQDVAVVERLDGEGGLRTSAGSTSSPTRLAATDSIRAGDRLETGLSGRLALKLSGGVSVRLDRGSRLRLASARQIDLEAGSVYVDNGSEGPSIAVHTPLGVARDIGTQFEMRLTPRALRVRVRSGSVEIQRDGQVSTATTGTEVTVSLNGTTSRPVTPYDPEWAWAASLAPALSIEGRPLAELLEHVCREEGWRLTYEAPSLARDASRIILHGSIERLSPADVLAVVLRTSGLTYRVQDGELRVAGSGVP